MYMFTVETLDLPAKGSLLFHFHPIGPALGMVLLPGVHPRSGWSCSQFSDETASMSLCRGLVGRVRFISAVFSSPKCWSK